MPRLLTFFKATASGGLFVILPVLLIYLLVAEALDLITALAMPIAEFFLGEDVMTMHLPVLVSLALLVTASFLVGLAMRAGIGRRLGLWIEDNLLNRLPAYSALKRLTQGFVQTDEREAFRPALLTNSDKDRDIVYLIEDHGNGLATVLLPWAPTPFAGSVKIVERRRLQLLDANLGDFSRVLSHWGHGVKDLMPPDTPAETGPEK